MGSKIRFLFKNVPVPASPALIPLPPTASGERTEKARNPGIRATVRVLFFSISASLLASTDLVPFVLISQVQKVATSFAGILLSGAFRSLPLSRRVSSLKFCY